MIDLSTTYLGMRLRTPLVAAASPISRNVELARQLEEAGLGAIVMYSLFEEQIIQNSLEIDRMLSHGAESFAEALSYFPEHGVYSVGPERYLEQVAALKKALSIPVIGSLNGVSAGGWVHYARLIQEAGADALELNIYFIPVDTSITSSELEDIYIDLVRAVRAEITIPLAVKIGPYITALPHFAARLREAGADALVLFNRFYQPDFDLEQLEVRPNLQLSSSAELRLPLRWIALLYGRIPVEFAISSGIHSAIDALKGLMAGANVAMIASALLRGRAPDVLRSILHDMELWLTEHEYESIRQLHGSMSQKAVAEPAAFERANYVRVLEDYRPPYALGSHTDLTGRMLYPFIDEV
ncbi:MAG: dihydroorotate dehydrogenase-like protein [Chloroflexus sp.]|jgi:Dihydroorotate dehydrogenase|nr:dihydroorotate dehydrogenase-like protein [Chloroflexus sp.]MBO9314749.1 dihydroorotate dehydrogenase-like protein [Chloroflexus sp.]MBO9374112.1 dihydroorotate dehydrogenase-like protein [Chloroflexus sp.]